MSKSNNIYTHTAVNLDRRIWITLLIVGLLSMGLFAYKIADNVKCTPFDIDVKGYSAGKKNSFYLGQTIEFKTTYTGKETIVWDFGDKGTAKGIAVKHSYQHEGNFIVSATVNGKCVETLNLTIIQLEQQKSASTVSMENPISGPELVYAGDPATFTCALAANTYEWMILNAPEFPVQANVNATFTFPIEGTRIIELKLDHDPNKVFRKNIQVLPQVKTAASTAAPSVAELPPLPPPVVKEEKPDPEKDAAPAKPKVLIIPNEEFKSLLEAATEGKTDLQTISQYLCNGAQTKALLNGTDWETVGSFMAKVYNKKKFDIKEVEAVRDENNCVTILKIKYKKRLL